MAPPGVRSRRVRTVRVIPCLDVDRGRVVKGVNFVGLRDAGDPVELAARYDREGADEVVFLDITASSDARETILDVARRTAEEVFIPFTVGGGIRAVDDARRLLRAGADKVSVNTAAVDRPELVGELAAEFGAQCVVVAVDARRSAEPGVRLRRVHPRRPQRDAARRRRVGAAGRGARRRRDPADLDGPGRHPGRLRPRADPGGGGRGERPGDRLGRRRHAGHLVDGVTEGGADAVLAASIFHFGEHTVGEAKAALAAAGLSVRL